MANTTRTCVICGERHDCVDITTHDNCTYTVCEKCASEQFKRSCVTGRWVYWPTYLIELGESGENCRRRLCHNGLFMLIDEYRFGGLFDRQTGLSINRGGGWRYCDECGLPHQDLRSVNVQGVEYNVCKGCVEDLYYDYERCVDCGSYFFREDDEGYTNHDGEYVCQSCRDNNWRTCEYCGELYQEDDERLNYSERLDTYICNNCWDSSCEYEDDDDFIHEYSYKPISNFRNTEEDELGNTLYFGTENEHSHGNSDDLYRHSRYIAECYDPDGKYESHFYQKSDSSLENGTEVVSHPMSLSYWQKIRPHVEKVFAESRRYADMHDGLHVHLSRNGMTSIHEDKFVMFFELCRTSVEFVARRSSDDYAAFLDEDDVDYVVERGTLDEFLKVLYDKKGNRYRCVNFQNNRTVEVRVFASTLRPAEYYTALEFCHAAYQFTKRVHMVDIFKWATQNILWDCFLNFAADDKRYSTMMEWLDMKSKFWGSTMSNMDDWVYNQLTKFDRLDTFLDRMPTPVTGGHVLSRLVFGNNDRQYVDSNSYEIVPQPASVWTQHMDREVRQSMYSSWNMMMDAAFEYGCDYYNDIFNRSYSNQIGYFHVA